MPLEATEGKTGGIQEELKRAAMHYTLLLPFAFPKVLAKKQEQGEQQRCDQNKKTDQDKEVQSK